MLVVGGSLIAGGAIRVFDENEALDRFEARSRLAITRESEGEEASVATVDWSQLGNHGVAWLTVENTSIDHPVAQAFEDDADYFLSHDLWGSSSGIGCPFVDYRTHADASHVLVLAHRLSTSGRLFAELQDAHEQGSFERLGRLTWTTPNAGQTIFRPICATEVDMADRLVQSFSFDSEQALRSWLMENLERSSARSARANDAAQAATRVVTLVTCSAEGGGQRLRSAVMFAA